jgi:hypothetical protein
MLKRMGMKFPIIKNDESYYPKKGLCPVCKKNKVCEPNSMVVFSGGACLMDKQRKSGGPHQSMDAFLNIAWHGAHDHGVGKDRDQYRTIDIVEDVKGGQFEFYFCSKKCFKDWINKIIDIL